MSPVATLPRTTVYAILLLALAGCAAGSAPAQCPEVAPAAAPAPAPAAAAAPGEAERLIASVIDDWHDAAARADEERYFGHLSEDAVFLGTDATERWDKKAFRAYSHPHSAKGKAWSFRSVRRAIVIAPGGGSAWFDEDLATERLGPARGSGALVRVNGAWQIAQYNLSIPIPNDRFDQVKKIIAEPAAPKPP